MTREDDESPMPTELPWANRYHDSNGRFISRMLVWGPRGDVNAFVDLPLDSRIHFKVQFGLSQSTHLSSACDSESNIELQIGKRQLLKDIGP
jgi:hypothetical protein